MSSTHVSTFNHHRSITGVKVAVLGSGSWGTTFAKLLADAAAEREDKAASVVLWARRAEVAEAINTRHLNPEYLEDIELPRSITATTDAAQALDGADLVVVAVPAQQVRTQLEAVKPHIGKDAVVVSLVKGLERETDLRMSQLCIDQMGIAADRFATVSGPNLAMEIARMEPTATVIASSDEATAAWAADLTVTSYFRPYRNTDVAGVEIGGVVKNVIALAVGLCDGQGLGDNSKASIMTRGLAETTRLAMNVGAQAETLSGLAGLGDLVATCASPLSRNRTAGRLIGQGCAVEDLTQHMSQTAEGVKSVSAVVALARRVRVEMPICEAMNSLVNGSLDIESIAGLLLTRNLKSEG